jgi:glutamate mutase epsilon subunit
VNKNDKRNNSSSFLSGNDLVNYGVDSNHKLDGIEVKTPLMIMKGSKYLKS